jgi:hypothetical protein
MLALEFRLQLMKVVPNLTRIESLTYIALHYRWTGPLKLLDCHDCLCCTGARRAK